MAQVPSSLCRLLFQHHPIAPRLIRGAVISILQSPSHRIQGDIDSRVLWPSGTYRTYNLPETFLSLEKGHSFYVTIRRSVGRCNYTLLLWTTKLRNWTEEIPFTYLNQRLPERTPVYPLQTWIPPTLDTCEKFRISIMADIVYNGWWFRIVLTSSLYPKIPNATYRGEALDFSSKQGFITF